MTKKADAPPAIDMLSAAELAAMTELYTTVCDAYIAWREKYAPRLGLVRAYKAGTVGVLGAAGDVAGGGLYGLIAEADRRATNRVSMTFDTDDIRGGLVAHFEWCFRNALTSGGGTRPTIDGKKVRRQ